jgi:hypothetical protein
MKKKRLKVKKIFVDPESNDPENIVRVVEY